MAINNYSKCKWTTIQSKDIEWLNGFKKGKTHL